MKMTFRISRFSRSAGTLAILAAVGQPWMARADEMDDPRNRFQFGARAGLNLRVEFHDTAAPLVPVSGAAGGGRADRNYSDGFVRVDGSGNSGGETWNWGYERASQVQAPNAAIGFHDYSGNPWGGVAKADDDPQYGAEIGYTRVLGEFADALWGFELGFNWMDFEVEHRAAMAGQVTQIIDSYPLNGVIPPTAPYAGSFDGPGPVLGESPSRLTAPAATAITGYRKLSGNLYGFKVGPVLDIPLGDWLSGQLSGGLAVGWLDGDFRFQETATVSGAAASWSRAESIAKDDWVFGGYARGQLTVRLSPRAGLYGAAEYQTMENPELGTASRVVRIDMGNVVYFGLGLNLRF